MPFQIIHYKKGHENKEFPHFMLKNIHTGEMVKKHFRDREGAIGFARNAIRYREKVDSKVVGNKILPIKKKDDKKKKETKPKPKPKTNKNKKKNSSY